MARHRTLSLTAKGHAAVDAMRDGDEFTVRNLTANHFGCEVTITGLTGTLVGLVPVGDRVQAAMIVGGAHIWTDALPGGTRAEVLGRSA